VASCASDFAFLALLTSEIYLNICNEFGSKWDILFNPAKTQCVTFGEQAPKNFIPVIGGKRLSWSFK